MVIDKAIEKAVARPGVTRAANDPRAIDIDPKAIMDALHLPVALAEPGAWSLTSAPEAINLSFASS
jgi:hypothetical protein